MDIPLTYAGLTPLARLDTLWNWDRGSRSRMAPTIAPMRDLLVRLGNPHLAFAVVHVTGTKGKGSVCALVEAALHDAGFRVGRYASPHVDSICERVSLRRKPVPQDRLVEAIGRVLDVRDQTSLAGTPGSDATWFDVLTAAAFLLFARERLDWVVAEVGLGGRLDSTNVLEGKVCVVTNIGLEHTDVLGDTPSDIAREKAGIVKRGTVVVTGVEPGTEPHEIIRARTAELAGTLVDVPAMPGIAQQNEALARAVLDSLGRLGVVAPRGGLPIAGAQLDPHLVRSACLPGRMERLCVETPERAITLVLDGAHVDIALDAVLNEAQIQPWATGPVICLVALGKDKNPHRMLEMLRGRTRHVLFTQLDGRECRDPEGLVAIAAEMGFSCSAAPDAGSGLHSCLRLAREDGWVLATGSLHIVAPVRRAARELKARLPR